MEENLSLSNSILSTVKKLLGIPEEDDSFDLDITLNINAAISTLYQLGVIKTPFTVTSKEDTYEDLIPGGSEDVISQIKMYLFYKTKLGFDSMASTGAVIDITKELIKESEWRLMASFNPEDTFE